MLRKGKGLYFVYRNEEGGHFMTAETTVKMFHELLTAAFDMRREALGLHQRKGLLVADAFTGNFGTNTGNLVATTASIKKHWSTCFVESMMRLLNFQILEFNKPNVEKMTKLGQLPYSSIYFCLQTLRLWHFASQMGKGNGGDLAITPARRLVRTRATAGLL